MRDTVIKLLTMLLVAFSVASGSPDAHEILIQSVKVTEMNWIEAPNYSFTRADTKTNRDHPPVKVVHEVRMIEGSPYLKIIEEDGPLTMRRQAEEDQKLQGEMAKRSQESLREREKRTAKYRAERNRDHAILMELADAFNYHVTGEQKVDGHDAWVLCGTPKAGYIPKSAEAKVLSGMTVNFWVDKGSYQWLRIEATVEKPVTLYGWLAKVGLGTKFILEQAPVSAKLWLPKHFNIQVNASALGFLNRNFTHDEIYLDYQPTPSLQAQSGTTVPRKN